jgi:predicted acetyltransferase
MTRSDAAPAQPPARSRLRLRPLRLDDEAAALRAHAELEQDEFPFLLEREPTETWAGYLRKLANYRRGIDLPSDRVPATFLVAVVDGELVGRVSIRHVLNDYLTRFGGHIGYGVRPAHRRRGHASEILRQALVIARAEGIDSVLITCDDDNVASAKVIERHGGVLEDIRPEPGGPAKRRYWIS